MASHEHSSGHWHPGDDGHNHGAGVTDERRIAIAFFIILVFMIVEAIGGILAGSLALLADAGHMVSDTAALGMSWAAIRVGRRPADSARSFGYKRIEVLAAFVNGCTLFLIAGWILFEAIRRFSTPVHVLGGTMLWVAIAGLVANIVAFYVLNGGNRDNLNMKSAWLHILGDLFGFVVAIIGAGVILWTGWSPIDPILSVVVAVVILPAPLFRAIPNAWSCFHRWCVVNILGIEVREEGKRPAEPALYAIKHESFFEAIDLGKLLDNPVPFAKEELFRIPGWGRVARAYGNIPVMREAGAKALRAMMTEARRYIGRPVIS